MAEGPPKVLVVEDDLGKRYTITRQLRAAGFDVVEAATGEDGLRLAREAPDVVVLDIKLPDLDGFEVCRRIKADPACRGVLVLELSARYSTAADRAKGLEQGADAYLVHPIEVEELIATVRALLRLRASERARAALAVEVAASEQRYRTVTETASVGLCLVDLEGRCTFMNRAAEELTGRRFADVAGQVFHDLVHGRRADGTPYPASECPVHDVARLGEPVRRHRDIIVRPDGWIVPVEMNASPIGGDAGAGDGPLVGAVIEIKDVSDLVRAELQRELFLASLGHDLRNPLQSLALGGEVLGRSPALRDRDRETLGRMMASSRRMQRLVEQMLVFAQSLVQGIPLERRPTDLAELAATAAREAALRFPDRRVDVVDELHAAVEVDPDRIAQVIDNLLGNALRHGDGAVRVRVAAGAGATAVLEVHNTGKPIAAQHMATLFDPFRRAGGRAGGVGLGLYIVDQIGRAHGGMVDVTSTAEAGTTFVVTLPVG